MKQKQVVELRQTEGQSIRILDLQDVRAKTSLGKTLLYKLIAEGKFPRQVRLVDGGKKVGWIEREVDAYLLGRAAARDQGNQ